MEVMFDRVAGLDVGKDSVTVCVRIPGPRSGRRSETRTFKTMFGSLRVMRDWLVEAGVRIAAMESTSTYWKPPFYCLEEVMVVWLLNAAHMKAVPGRKSDVRDAEWIAQLLEHGLLAPSFVPPPQIRRLRMLTRYRMQLMGDRTREMVRLELMLEDASIKLSSVASSLRTVSARAMLTAMIGGETDPVQLADLAKGKMRRKIPDLAQALTGTFEAHHAQLAKSMLRRLELVEQALAELDAVIAEACRPWQHQLELLQTIPGVGGDGCAGHRGRDGRGHVTVPDCGPFGCLGRVGAGDARVRRQTDPGWEATRQQMVDRDAGRGRRLCRPDAW
jgi:transposase